MKIIKRGAALVKRTPWPVGYKFRCARCGCEFEMEEGDNYLASAQKHPGGLFTVQFPCPNETCRFPMVFHRPRGVDEQNIDGIPVIDRR